MRLKIAIVLVFVVFSGCKESNETNNRDNVPGEYFALKDDNINIFLPSYFREFSEDEYAELIDQMPDSEEKKIEKNRFNFLKYSKGNMYYFKDVASSTLIGVKMGEYINFTKEESSYLLGIMSNSCSSYAEILGMNCEKLNAGYSGLTSTKVFKAAYKISNGKAYNHYNTMYLISSKYKTFSVSIFSNTNKNYNAFIEKIVVK